MKRIAVAALAVLVVALASVASSGGTETRRVTIWVRGWSCQEDEVLRGRGDFDGRRWDRYVCWNPGW
jgi:hypothetical protein